MDVTPRWALPLLFAGQAQKEMFHNEALVRIDALVHGIAQSADLVSPPSSPGVGQCWIVAEGAEGDWDGKDGSVALWTDGGWRFIAAQAGLRLLVADRDHALQHDGREWRGGAERADGLYVDELKVVGTRQPGITAPTGGVTIDSEARISIATMLTALRAHGLIHS
ncbi:DUF2793 domain-containing protein [Sphingobium sp. Ant17]|uniref:DUF2793 domain-containing protein n=1 Tax=Sphingobium sp. Ant17 TaxID=1461752 RepID=UPI00044934D4|nr:DUF2793 domain-containing protein [Sphingobium sp. Ant17]EXS67914.1 hypothetical protein BF95_01125 [Sphingobium sp. Ant17]MDE0947875.1 DUF2793 domain-containing protein [Sphingobium sp.]|tara:strand:- start:800 stop:1297 length:498 start_codon:yes stop_codon:yes gene_type:complete